jgi:hypothetical protein
VALRARGIAYSALGDVPAAEREQRAFESAARQRCPRRRRSATIPPHRARGRQPMLAGEIAYGAATSSGLHAAARRRFARDEALHYDEPVGLDDAGEPRARRAAARSGAGRGSRAGLPARPRAPPEQRLGAVRPGGMPAPLRQGRGGGRGRAALPQRPGRTPDVELHASCFCSMSAATAR